MLPAHLNAIMTVLFFGGLLYTGYRWVVVGRTRTQKAVDVILLTLWGLMVWAGVFNN